MKKVFPLFIIFVFQIAGINVMAEEGGGNDLKPRQWSMVWTGGWRFGDYGMSVDDTGMARLTLLSTSNRSDVSGAGIIEARDGLYDQNAANRVRLALCDSNSQAGRGLKVVVTDPAAMFWASCELGGAY